MSKRKVKFAEETSHDEKKATNEKSRRFKEKHSIDSDEEYEGEEEKLDEDDIEGQEDGTVDYDEGIRITPFNMKEELEEGHFDKHGTYIFSKDKDVIQDAWMDNIDWQKIKETEGGTDKMEAGEDSDSEPEHADLKGVYSNMLKYLQPGETVAKALRRLGGNNKGKMSSADRWKAKKQKTAEATEADKKAAEDKQKFLDLTELADKLLQEGNMDAYELTHEKVTYELKRFENGQERLKIPEGTKDDDALDMFAEDFDNKEAEKIEKDFQKSETAESQTTGDSKGGGDSNEVMWEYKWEDKEESEVHGPYTSSQMLEWAEEGFFKSGVFCRKVGADSQFYSSRRIDFDLYT